MTVIAIDIDDVLFPFITTFIPFANNRLNTNLSLADIVTYRLDLPFNISYTEVVQLIDEYFKTTDHLSLKPLDGAIEALNRLSDPKLNHDLHLVTARKGCYASKTIGWVEHWFPDKFIGIHFANEKFTKTKICRSLNAILMIDDNQDNLFPLTELGMSMLLFGDYPWQASIPINVKNLTRMKSWQYFLDGDRS